MTFIYFGTPQFSAAILSKLVNAGFVPAAVVTQPDQPTGRKQVLTPSPLKVLAEKLGVPVLTPQKLIELKNQLPSASCQLLVIVAYGKIFRKWLLDWPSLGCLNMHASLLPKLRGASPIQEAILKGMGETGATIMLMDEGVDTGPILAQESLKIEPDETILTLSQKLADLGAQLIIKTLNSLQTITNKQQLNLLTKPQDDEQATYTKIIKKEDGLINWQTHSGQQIERMTRAYQSWPGVYTTLAELAKNFGLILKHGVNGSIKVDLIKTSLKNSQTNQPSLFVEILQLAGKNPITWQQFANGYLDKDPRV